MSCFEQLGKFGRAAREKMGRVWWQFIGVETTCFLPVRAVHVFQVGRQTASWRCGLCRGLARNEFARQFIYPPTQR